MNKFMQAMTQKDTATWNGAVSNSSSGSTLLDYFSKSGTYRKRDISDVFADMSALFAIDKLSALKMVFYNRMITRKPVGENVDSVQRGQGQRDEFIKCLAYLEQRERKLLEDNLWLVPVVGRWQDLWYDSAATGFYYYVDTNLVYPLVEKGMQNENMRGLIAKYLPKIRSKSNVKNDRHRRLNAWAKGLCKYLGWTELQYRLFKSSPENTAHLWQRQMCWNKWNAIDFDKIPGKALTSFVKSVENHGLSQAYVEWLQSKPTAKYTGYPFELYKEARANGSKLVNRITYNKQFAGLVEKGKEGLSEDLMNSNVLCALDTSGSMSWSSFGGVTPLDVCVGLGIYFSSLNTGAFKDTVVMFSDRSTTLKLHGEFCDKVDQINKTCAMGSTNFQSVIDLIVNIRRNNPSIPIEDYPKVLLVVSDMQFNPTHGNVQTNYEVMMSKLTAVGLPKMSVIWWQVTDRTKDVPSTMFDEGTTLISGYDGAIISAVLGTKDVVDEKTGEVRKPTPIEVMNNALDQELLNKLTV